MQKYVKAPVIPHEKPKAPDASNPKMLVDENTWLWEAFENLLENVKRGILPLHSYVDTFAVFKEEFELDPPKYVAALDEGENPITPEELKEDIIRNRQKEEDLKQAIPEHVIVGMFQVNCKDIRNLYSGKYSQIVTKEINLIAEKAKNMNYMISTKFGEINETIMKQPNSIEELTEIKKFISEIGVKIEKLKRDIDGCMGVYGILDDFEYEFSSSEQNSKWELYGAPKKVVELIEKQAAVLEKTKERFIKEMLQEQEEFEDTLDHLQITVGGFHTYDNIDKFIDNAKASTNVDDKI